MRLFLLAIMLFTSSLFALSTITLTKSNSVIFDSEVTADSTGQALFEIYNLYAKGVTEIYLVLNTPGGSVPDGLEFIDAIKSLPIKVHTITIFAASMGYQIAQSLDTRFIMTNGTLMSHRASGGMEGIFNGSLNTRITNILQILEQQEIRVAKRLKISLVDYRKMIADELWISGKNAIENNQADEEVNIICGKDMIDIKTKRIYVFGIIPVDLQVSECPLIKKVFGFKIPDGNKNTEDIENYINLMINDKPSFIRKFVQGK